VPEDLDIEIVRARTTELMAALVEGGHGPKAMARELTRRGHPVKERTVASWREGRYFPTVDVVVLMHKITGVRLDENLDHGEGFAGFAMRIAQLEETQARLVSWVLRQDPQFPESVMTPQPAQAERSGA
jgi:hypothetical protein